MADPKEKGLNALPMKIKILLIALCPILVIALCSVVVVLYAGSLVDEGIYTPPAVQPVYATAAPETAADQINTVNTLLTTAQTDGETQIESSETVDFCNLTSTFTEAQTALLQHAAGNMENAASGFSDLPTLAYGETASLFPALNTAKIQFEQTEDHRFVFTAEIENTFADSDFVIFDKMQQEFLTVLTIDIGNITPEACTAVFTVDPTTDRMLELVYTRTYHLEYTVTFIGDLTDLGTVDAAFDAILTRTHTFKKAGIAINQEQIVLHKNGYEALNRTLNIADDAEPEDYSLTFTSSDESIATVDEKGQVEAVSLSPTPITITATLVYLGKTYTDTCEVLVINEPERVEMKSKAQSLTVGDTVQLDAKIKPDNATIKTMLWYSPDESIATVDANGLVTAVSPGKVQIIAVSEIGSYMAGCTVTVEGGAE